MTKTDVNDADERAKRFALLQSGHVLMDAEDYLKGTIVHDSS